MKPSTAKQKGRDTENRFVDYLARWVPHAERRRLAGTADRGDITGMPGFVWEVKSGARVDIAGWLNELDAEIRNDRADMGAVVVRPAGTVIALRHLGDADPDGRWTYRYTLDGVEREGRSVDATIIMTWAVPAGGAQVTNVVRA